MGEIQGTLDAKELASLSMPSDIVIPDMTVPGRLDLPTAFDVRVGGPWISRKAKEH